MVATLENIAALRRKRPGRLRAIAMRMPKIDETGAVRIFALLAAATVYLPLALAFALQAALIITP